MTTDPYEAVREAELNKKAAENTLHAAKLKVEGVERRFREALTVGRHVPCTVAVLPNGKVVVHVWATSESESTQLYVVTPKCHLDEEGRPKLKGAVVDNCHIHDNVGVDVDAVAILPDFSVIDEVTEP